MQGAGRGILSYFTRHGTAANLLLVILLASGLLAIPQMRAQFFPDVVVDDLDVSITWDGAGAEDVDGAIVQLLEPVLLAVEGVTDASSSSREGGATITLEFEPDYDIDRAVDEVQSALDQVNDLPEDAEDPQVVRGGWRDRVTDVVITGPIGVDQLARFADEFVVRLFDSGVTRTTIRGVAAPQTLIEVPSYQLIAHDLSMAEIASAIAAEVSANPAGDVDSVNARVRTGVEKRGADQIAAIVLKSNQDGTSLTVGDVADIRVEGVDRARTYFVGSDPAITIRVDRSPTGDAIGIQRSVEEVAAQMQATLPEGTTIDLIRTRAEAITGRLNILQENGLMGLGLVVLLLFLFLNARIALWVAAGIPVAMLAGIALMYAFGITINMISLFALIITLGIVVDDAIVVGEHADFRARRLGEDAVTAAENAARRMILPVFAATITTVTAFFGLVTIGGRFGELIADIPFTVIVVLIASIVECFLILPNHLSHALAHTAQNHWYDWPSRQVNKGFRWVRDVVFRRVMQAVVTLRYPVLALAILLLASQAARFISGQVTWRFFNAPERSSVSGNFVMINGADRSDSIEMMRELQRATEAVASRFEGEHGVNPVTYAIAEIGGNTGRPISGSGDKDSDLLGSIAIELVDADARPYSSFEFVAALQEEVNQHPLAEIVSFRGFRSGPGGDALDVQFYGATAETLKAASEALKDALIQFPEVSAVEDNLAYDKQELVLELTAQGQALGFDIDSLGTVIRNRLNGIEAASYPLGPRSATIRVELPEGETAADFLDRMMMRTAQGEYVPLSDIVSVTRRDGFSTVRRENGIRLISITGDVSEDDPARAAEIQSIMEQDILPQIASEYQVEFRIAGLSEQEDEFLSDARTGLILVLLTIYLILAWVFASWSRPLVVMSVIPFGLVGAIWGHFIWDVPLSMFTVVGLLGMTGIVINDSIVLVTTIDEYAKERGIIPSIIDGATDRFRPVLLTTLTTVLGLAPLLYETSADAQFLKPTVITLAYGLGFGMFLVLLVVPALIAIQTDIGRLMGAARTASKASRAPVVQRGTQLTALAIFLWGALTIGWVAVTGAALPQVAAVLPMVQSMGGAFVVFAVGTMVLTLIGFGLTASMMGRRAA
ncbi:efflux RND transporter permease subunit [Donghicola sp.]|jgi:multidrug efflux pump subunit AcrB|uniref:efflux RND transporter permease subunit n=1 Tax=Donghicola sp. TaxID=1929294 RepID=UPI0025E89A68|nr:efflux RND transporter permease subunit [Donghicola sp.]MCT4579344.1 efflux RND transporter permease subunit [Donghicola sp.]